MASDGDGGWATNPVYEGIVVVQEAIEVRQSPPNAIEVDQDRLVVRGGMEQAPEPFTVSLEALAVVPTDVPSNQLDGWIGEQHVDVVDTKRCYNFSFRSHNCCNNFDRHLVRFEEMWIGEPWASLRSCFFRIQAILLQS